MLKNQKNNCWHKNCKTCKEVGLWEYVWGITFKEFFDTVRWSTIVFMMISVVAGYAVWGWFGVLLGWEFFYLMARAEDGAVADVWNEFPDEEYPPNTCSANIKGCTMCDNEYEHSFNEKYNQNLKWYEKII